MDLTTTTLRAELIQMMVGLKVPESPGAASGAAYWREGDKWRDLKWNWAWFGNPRQEFENVKFRAYLFAAYLAAGTGLKSEFAAVPGPQYSADLLSKSITPEEALLQSSDLKTNLKTFTGLTPEGNKSRRALHTALTLGIRTQNKKATIGFGVRRRVEAWLLGSKSEALRCDLEFYVGAFTLDLEPDFKLTALENPSLQTGLAVSRVDPASGTAPSAKSLSCNFGEQDISGLRVYGAVGADAKPQVTLQIRDVASGKWADVDLEVKTGGQEPDNWEKVKTWANAFVSVEKPTFGVSQLLEAPLAPADLQRLSFSPSMLTLAMSPGTIPQKAQAQLGLDAKYFQSAAGTAGYLRNMKSRGWNAGKVKAPAEPAGRAQLPEQKDTQAVEVFALGNFLATVGLLSSTSGQKDDVKLPYYLTEWEDWKKKTFWEVFSNALTLADGIPLFLVGSSLGSGAKYQEFGTLYLALQLASVAGASQADGNRFGIRGVVRNYLLTAAAKGTQGKGPAGAKPEPAQTGAKGATKQGAASPGDGKSASGYQVWLQLGKWFSVDSLQDNWFRRLMPTINPGSGAPTKPPVGDPGIGVYPFALTPPASGQPAKLALDWQLALVSLGLDLAKKAPANLIETPRFKLGSVEVRMALISDLSDGGITAVGGGVLLKDIRLDLSGKQTPAKAQDQTAAEDDMSGAMQQLFAEPNETGAGAQPPPAKPAPAFSLSCGYLYSKDHASQVDFQLYDARGKRGEVAWIMVERQLGPFTLSRLGFGLRKWETGAPELDVLIEGSLKLGSFELDLLGAGVALPLKDMGAWYAIIQGVAFSLSVGSTYLEGGLLKRRGPVYREDGTVKEMVTQYGGFVSVRPFNKFTIEAMGAWGTLADGATTLFIYGMLPLGQGVGNAVFKVTGLALGAGLNRRVKEPPMSRIADFPLVRAVMGTSKSIVPLVPGAEPAEPMEVLAAMAEELPIEEGAYFGCFGLRFSIVEVVDCFALAVVDLGSELEIMILGFARIKQPSSGWAICYLDLALKAALKPSEGSLLVQAQLTESSWVLSESCRLTGGFAVASWFAGEHAGDFVVTIGGYHPRFQRPAHYPIVPRLGLNWNVTGDLLIKGGMYFALTPSAIMAGGRLEALFSAGPISARFLAYADFLVQWKPLYYDIAIGIEIDVSLDLALFTLSASIGVDLALMGPPVHGNATVHLAFISFTITFGDTPDEPPYLEDWAEFGQLFLAKSKDKAEAVWQLAGGKTSAPALAPPVARVDCARGILVTQGAADSTADRAPAVTAAKAAAPAADPQKPWLVRAEELELNATTLVPATSVRVFAQKGSKVENLADENDSGKFWVRSQGISFKGKILQQTGPTIGIRPMNLRKLTSTLNVAIVRSEAETAIDLNGESSSPPRPWSIEYERTGCPAALWDTEPAAVGNPSAKVIAGCIVGVKSMKPPPGGPEGAALGPFTLEADALTEGLPEAERVAGTQDAVRPAPGSAEDALTGANAARSELLSEMKNAGFTLPPEPSPSSPPSLRTLYAPPLSGRLTLSNGSSS